MKRSWTRPAAAVAAALALSALLCAARARGEEAAPEEAPREETSPPAAEGAPTETKAPDADEAARDPGERPEGPLRPDGEAEVMHLSLENCLELARERNLDMLIEENRREKARLEVASARAAFLPTFTMSYTRDYELEKDSGTLGLSQSMPWGMSLSVAGRHSTDAGESDSSIEATLSQDLLRGLGPASGLASLRMAEQNRLAALERFERRCQDTVLNVKRQYFDIARLMATVEVRRRAVERARSLREEAKVKRDLGMKTLLDQADADIQLADRKVALVSSEKRLADALDGLKEMLDLPLGEEIEIEPVSVNVEQRDAETERTEVVVDETAGTVSMVRTRKAEEGEARIDRRQVFAPVERDEAALKDEAMKSRPDLRAARFDLAAKQLELRRKRYQLFNELKLSATYTAEGEGEASEDSLDVYDEGWKLSVNYSWPVGRRARRADYEKALLDLETRETEVKKLEVAVEQEIRRISRSLHETETNILTHAQKISAAELAVKAAKIRKELGQMTYRDVAERESELLDAETSFINSYLDYQKQLAELDRAVGKRSGWAEEP